MSLILSSRLGTVANLVCSGTKLVDIGTDHGYLPVKLLLDGEINSAIATDLREKPLNQAKKLAARYGVSDLISFRLGNGLSCVEKEETETVVIAGMGGETISAMLQDAPWTKEETVLLVQPMTSIPKLRKWFQENGYNIRQELVAQEGKKFYVILDVCGGCMEPLSPVEMLVGKQSSDPLRYAYLDYMRGKVYKVLCGLKMSYNQDYDKIVSLTEIYEQIEDMLSYSRG